MKCADLSTLSTMQAYDGFEWRILAPCIHHWCATEVAQYCGNTVAELVWNVELSTCFPVHVLCC